ncbi:PREDICTED: 2',5'-phosphodiesterase 12-like, partial [Cyprinodon variegatus]|uniref:2',5'-phosphodiesterase 12-like n=1 Tax=Cyprinodon variegatus TaxID=28743 RepID=UPI000742A7EA
VFWSFWTLTGVFVDSLSPALDAYGLDGVFRLKEKQHEGLATFYRRSKFRLLSRHDIMLSEALASDPAHSELLEKVSANGGLKDKILQRSTSLQVSLLEDLEKPGRKVCVANTHLYWHPKGNWPPSTTDDREVGLCRVKEIMTYLGYNCDKRYISPYV